MGTFCLLVLVCCQNASKSFLIKATIMFARLQFYPSLLYTLIMDKISNRNWYDRIDETVLLGALPLKSLTDQLINEENVRGVVSMNEDYELYIFCNSKKEWESHNVEFLQLSSRDLFYEAPTQDKLIQGVQFIEKIAKTNCSVYVHCKAGRTRSPTLVGCYLMSKNGWTPKEAVNFMRVKRPHIFLFKKHWDALVKYYENCVCTTNKQNKIYIN